MRRVLILLLVLCLMGTAGAENHPTLTIGSKGAQVRQLQQRLSDLGVLDGAVDGAYGKQTAASVRTAQQWLIKQGHELAADGAAGPVTLQLLYDDEVMAELLAFRSGDRGARVIQLQNRLYDLNFLAEPPDGSFGPNTEKALRALQQVLVAHGAAGVAENGICDLPTQRALQGDLSPMGIVAPEFFDETQPLALTGEYLIARSALLVDAHTSQVLFEKQADQRMYPASTTKVMTLLVAVEQGGDLDRMVKVPRSAGDVPNDSSLVPVIPGEEMPLRALLHGLMIRSGNDAANAIAEILAGSVEGFVKKMNDKAQQLGMADTHYMNPHGYHDKEHYTTARDMATLCRAALQNPVVNEIAAATTYTLPATDMRPELIITSTAELLLPDTPHYYEGAYGIKSGFTRAAGFCYTGAAQKDGRTLIAIALNCRTRDQCWADMKHLFNFGFASTKAAGKMASGF